MRMEEILICFRDIVFVLWRFHKEEIHQILKCWVMRSLEAVLWRSPSGIKRLELICKKYDGKGIDCK